LESFQQIFRRARAVSTFLLTQGFFPTNHFFFRKTLLRLELSNQGEKEVALEGGTMTKVISQTTPEVVATKATPQVVKVSRKIVELISELSEVRATYNSAKARVDELRDEVLGVVGKADLTLVHNNIEVARIIESSPVRIDEQFLKENYPEAYEASLKPRPQFTIRSVSRKAK
jgi:hypothetical protein